MKASKRLEPVSISKRIARKLGQPILDYINHQTEIPVFDGDAGITLAEFVPDWRKYVANSLKPSTLRGMQSSIRARNIGNLVGAMESNPCLPESSSEIHVDSICEPPLRRE
jgi:hypothetical protein